MAASLILKTSDQAGNKSQKSITDINENATNTELAEFAEAINGLTTNTLTGANKVTTTDIFNTPEKLERNLVVKHNNTEITTISAAELPEKTASSGQYLIQISFDGAGTPYTGNVMERTGEVYICTVEGVDQWLLDLRKNNSPKGTITILIQESETYKAASVELTVTE